MSLLKKASIITTPTAYAEDYLYSIKPAYALGNNLASINVNLTNDFIANSGGVIVDADTFTTSGGSLDGVKSNTSVFSLTVGRRYQIEIQGNTTSSGFTLGNISASGNEYGSGFGVHTFVSENTQLWIRQNTAGTTNITKFTVQEITDADFDFTRNSTGTRVNEDYLIETVAVNTPRIDYTNGEPSILLEPSRTNAVTHSNDVTDSGNVYTNMSGSVNQTTSPEGISNAGKLTESTANAEHFFQRTQATSSGNYYTVSFFAKYNGRGASMNIGASRLYAHFDLETGEVIASGNNADWQNLSTDIINYGNGWYRCIMTGESVTGAGGYIRIGTNNGSTAGHTSSYTGDGTSGIFIYGIQMEIGSYATSLIHTSGSAVTRSQDVASNAGNSDLISSVQGVLYAEVNFKNVTAGTYLSISDGSSSNRIIIGVQSGTARIYASSLVTTFSIDFDRYNKIAYSYKANERKIFLNGESIYSSTASYTVPTGLNELSFDSNGQGGQDTEGNVKSVMVFKEALTDLELEKLTGYNNHELYMNYYNRLSYLGLAEEYNVESDINNYIL